MSVINTHNFGRFWSLSCTITHGFGVPGRLPRLTIPGMCLCVRRQHSKFWPILTRFVDYYSLFCGPGVISPLTNRGVRLRVGHQHSQFWPILARFVEYYSLVCGPGVISTINKPWGAFTCLSSTLTILADFRPFQALLLIVLGCQSDVHD